jgi:hypothetical protein
MGKHEVWKIKYIIKTSSTYARKLNWFFREGGSNLDFSQMPRAALG